MEFNSLDAQRESCEAYVASQKAEGWVLMPDRYDDGGFSGGTLERPALRRLLADIEDGRVDVIVVYKIDRLSRSLMDFAKLVEVFDRNGVTFVSVTQSFNTTTSMGRLTLNILLSFAQFEREVIGERIRDKFAASRKKGMWMGGWAPLGYRVKDRKLIIDKAEAAKVRHIFETFVRTRSTISIVRELADEGFANRYGQRLDKGRIYKLLHNRVYIGEAVHKGKGYPGEHKAIIPKALWDKVQAILAEAPRRRANSSRAQTPALLKGLIFGPTGRAMSPTHTRRGQKLYRYYVSQSVIKGEGNDSPINRVPGRGDRAGRHRPASHPAPLARDHRRHVARSRKDQPRPDRDRGPRVPPLLRRALGRVVPRRASAHRPASRRAGADRHRRYRYQPAYRWAQRLPRRVACRRRSTSGGVMATGPRQRAMRSDQRMEVEPSTVAVHVPMQFRRHSGRKAIVAAQDERQVQRTANGYDPLVTALARAFYWRKLIETGAHACVAEIAAAQGVSAAYVSRLMRLTLLKPETVLRLLQDRPARGAALTLAEFARPISAEWAKQFRRS